MNYQAEYGGKIHKLTDVEVEQAEIEKDNSLAFHASESECESYCILNLKDIVQLQNGFRYVKE